MDEQRPGDAQKLEHPRHHEHLEEETEKIHGAEQAAVRLAHELLASGLEFRSVSIQRACLLDDVAAEQVLARGIHDVEQDRQRGNEHQITILANQLERAGLPERLLSHGGLFRRLVARGNTRGKLRQEGNHDQHASCRKEQSRRAATGDDRACADGTNPRTEAAADADQWKQPPALFLGIEVGRKRPELGDRHQVEDAHPEEIDDADVEPGANGRDESDEIQREEQCHPLDQANTVDAGGEGRVPGTRKSSRTACPADE